MAVMAQSSVVLVPIHHGTMESTESFLPDPTDTNWVVPGNLYCGKTEREVVVEVGFLVIEALSGGWLDH